MQNIHHPFNQCQSQSISLGSVRRISLIKFFKNVCPHIRINTAARICNRNNDRFSLCPEGKRDFPSVRGEFKCIGQQIVPYKTQEFLVSEDAGAFFQFGFPKIRP